MSRINTNVQSLLAQRVLGQNNASLSLSLERLSTGLKINRGKDDPAGLIASENLRAEQRAIGQAIANAERADQVVNIGEGGLQEVSSLLTELQGLLTASANSAGLGESERTANQLQVDSILQTIDRISSSVSFQGVKLLNGNFDYQTSGRVSGVSDVQINGAKFQGASLDVDILVTQSAQQAGLFLSAGGATINLGDSGGEFRLDVTGSLGARELTFASGAALADIVTAINTFKDVTGVEATVSGTGIKLSSTEFGKNHFVSVTVLDDGGITGTGVGIYDLEANDFATAQTTLRSAYAAAGNGVRDSGQDIGASINGIKAVANGRDIRINTDFLDVALTLDITTSQSLGSVNGGTPGAAAFTITGGGADFQLAGQVDISGKVSIGIGEVSSRRLGSSTVGFLDDLASGKAYNLADGEGVTNAQKIVSQAIDQVSSLRGRLGAFQKNTVGATVRNLAITLENTQAAESVIRDTDFATETASLTRGQILVAAATNVLSLANTQPQNVLQLLG